MRGKWWIMAVVWTMAMAMGEKRKGRKSQEANRKGMGGGQSPSRCPVGKKASLEQLMVAGNQHFGRDYEIAESCYLKAVEMYPDSALALYNYGLTQMNQHRHDEALRFFKEAIKLVPTYAEAYFGVGSTLYDSAKANKKILADALQELQVAVRLNPTFVAAYNQLGNTYSVLQKISKAEEAYKMVVKLNPAAPEGHANLARMLQARGDASSGVKAIQQAISSSPAQNPSLYHELANAYKSQGNVRLATRAIRTGLRLAPRQASFHYFLGELLAGTVYSEDKDIPGAMAHLSAAIRLDRRMAEAYMSLGMIFWGQGQLNRARSLLAAGLKERSFAEGQANLGIVLSDLGDYKAAVVAFKESMKLNPLLAEAPKCLGDTYKHLNRWDDAIKMYKKALSIRHTYWEALNDLVHALQHTCEWDEWSTQFAKLQKQLARELASGGQPLFVKPFHALVYPLSVDQMLLVARSYAARAIRLTKSLLPTPMKTTIALTSKRKLRVGWVSSNIGDHSLSHLMSSVFSGHGAKIEAFVFALNGDNDPGDPIWRNKIKKTMGKSHFVDISAISGVQGASIVNKKQIHLLIDLVGYTGGGERANEVFASKPSELQTSYMGFCASTGAPYMQHMIVDRVVAPPEFQSHFSEKLLVLPYSYFCNDHRQQPSWANIPSSKVSRNQFAELPSRGILLACFNQLYKIWMKILQRHPHAYLWLLEFPPVAVDNIRKEAKARGVSSDRLLFGKTLPKREYLERGALADLFLDTPLVNAHTSATDILWAGVPLLTLSRESMISRVAASLCLAAGRPEMVAANLEEYEQVASALVGQQNRRSARLERLRRATEHAKEKSPLFDTRLWVEHLDLSLALSWDSHLAGKGKDFHVIVRPTK